jgi:hypothetical protein
LRRTQRTVQARKGLLFRFVLEYRLPYTLVLIRRGQPRSQELFSLIGVLPELQKIARPILQMRIYEPSGSEEGTNTLLIQQAESSPGLPYVSP